jgi:hypothetical protein
MSRRGAVSATTNSEGTFFSCTQTPEPSSVSMEVRVKLTVPPLRLSSLAGHHVFLSFLASFFEQPLCFSNSSAFTKRLREER